MNDNNSRTIPTLRIWNKKKMNKTEETRRIRIRRRLGPGIKNEHEIAN